MTMLIVRKTALLPAIGMLLVAVVVLALRPVRWAMGEFIAGYRGKAGWYER